MARWRQSWYEVGHSLSTAGIFALVGLVIYGMNAADWTAMYTSIAKYGDGSILFLLLLLVIFHDTWFYWMHRAIHQPSLFKIIHKVHHQSHNPTPWAAFSFHPLEAFLEIGFLPIIVCLLPLHPLAIVLFSLWSILFNVMGHLGYEIFPKGFTQHPIFKWFNTPTHHNLHHQRSNCNYGLYFNFWDRVMQTNHKKYHEIFDEISGR
ncbi:MAG: sterol desaturase family protein [Saprospiraceae bacterium]